MKRKVSIRIFALVMSIIFMLLTFAGAGYVLINHGQVNAGYAVIPMSFCLVFTGIYSGQKKKQQEKNQE